jgi:excisionase family DNA binding protein
MERLIRVREVAEALGLQVSSIYDLCHRGVIPHVRISQGRKRCLIRFREADLQEFIRERSCPGERQPR